MWYRTLKTDLLTRVCAPYFSILVNKLPVTSPTNPLPPNLGYNPTHTSKSPIPAIFFLMIREMVLNNSHPMSLLIIDYKII